jgi:AraC family transcriptional regulator
MGILIGMSTSSEFEVTRLLDTDTVALRNVVCSGACRHRGMEECVSVTHLVFPYRGVYLRHVGGDQAVADANQVLFFNADEGYQVSHPMGGGDASLSLALSADVLRSHFAAAFRQAYGRSPSSFKRFAQPSH